ncbi:UNVERIFIED_CONTAM: hypothetical protein Sradi_2981600 [Sesamum radiatum]|uniref:Uncharacterized protein n=1 Tax=Sesamum radiatum TaxID=300843 RepID=A0AAW2S081_SESRA
MVVRSLLQPIKRICFMIVLKERIKVQVNSLATRLKGLQDVQYYIGGAPEDERQGVPFTEAVMAEELAVNCRTPAITEYDDMTDHLEHLSRFESAAVLHRFTDGIKCGVFITTFAGASAGSIEVFKNFSRCFNTISLVAGSSENRAQPFAI